MLRFIFINSFPVIFQDKALASEMNCCFVKLEPEYRIIQPILCFPLIHSLAVLHLCYIMST